MIEDLEITKSKAGPAAADPPAELASMTRAELEAWCRSEGLPAYRGAQIFQAIHRGLRFPEMTNLPLSLREALSEKAVDQPARIVLRRESALDGTLKVLISLRDGNCVEAVLMRYEYGLTLCISTQVGCRMGCRFCASTLGGLVRNLTAGEMLGEILAVNRLLRDRAAAPNQPAAAPNQSALAAQPAAAPDRVSRVVLMGSGEPLDNYDEVMRFLRLLREEDGVNISLRNVSLSTCGLVERMEQLAEENLPVTLCVSLHAPNDAIRRRTMPVANRYRIDEILRACRHYVDKTGRRVIFEYALSEGVNSLPAHAEELARRLRGLQCHVNLIPLNAVPERNLPGVPEETVRRFLETLRKNHISATRRREMGDDIECACGQLRRKHLHDLSPRS